MLKSLLVAAICFITFSCHSKTQQNRMSENPSVSCFKEFDLFSLQGINEIQSNDPIEQPYVCIDTFFDTIKIKYQIPTSGEVELKYSKLNDGYTRSRETLFGRNSISYHEYISKDTIYTLIYDHSAKNLLTALAIFSNNKLTRYAFDAQFYEPPSFNLCRTILNKQKIYSTREIMFALVKDSVKANIKFTNLSDPSLSHSAEESFFIGEHTLNWWYNFKLILDDMHVLYFG